MATINRPALGFLPRMITPQEAAAFLNVSSRTIIYWIKKDRIPYIKLPGGTERTQYRIPLGGLVSSLAGNYDLAEVLSEAEAHAEELGLSSEELKRVAIDGAGSAD
jgi:excisionase family DNA binding protein